MGKGKKWFLIFFHSKVAAHHIQSDEEGRKGDQVDPDFFFCGEKGSQMLFWDVFLSRGPTGICSTENFHTRTHNKKQQRAKVDALYDREGWWKNVFGGAHCTGTGKGENIKTQDTQCREKPFETGYCDVITPQTAEFMRSEKWEEQQAGGKTYTEKKEERRKISRLYGFLSFKNQGFALCGPLSFFLSLLSHMISFCWKVNNLEFPNPTWQAYVMLTTPSLEVCHSEVNARVWIGRFYCRFGKK